MSPASGRPDELPLRSAPLAGETIVGFVIRLAERNREDVVMAFARSVGFPFPTLTMAATRRFDLEPLARASVVPQSTLLSMSYWGPTDRSLGFRGRAVTRSAFIFARRAFCPACLAEAPYHRDAWDLTLAAACPRHAILLSYGCPACRTPTGWKDRSIATCRCGFDLARAPLQTVPSDELGGIREVHALFGIEGASGDASHVRWPEILRSLGAEDASSLMFHLGWYDSGRSGIPRSLADPEFAADIPSILARGYRVGLDWPYSFHDFLSRRSAETTATGRYGARRAFGPFLRWVTSIPAEGALSRLVWREIEQFFAMRHELRSRIPRLAAVEPEGEGLMTLREAARTLRRSVERVGPVLRRHGLLVGTDGRGKGAPILVNAAVIKGLGSEMEDLLGKRSLRDRFGCNSGTLEAILAAGLLPPVQGIPADLCGRPRWRKSDADAFLARLSGNRSATKCLPFEDALRHLVRYGSSTLEAVVALTEGAIPPLVRNDLAVGLKGVLYEAETVAVHTRYSVSRSSR